MKDRHIGIAMSGGVDSTACALLLRDSYQIKGFFMHLGQEDFPQQKDRVETIANRLSIPLQVVDLRQEFNKEVLDYFSNTYFQGRTPNPCVICNKEIKFGLFMASILGAGMDVMATGHYARIKVDQDIYRLYTGSDSLKDQSYFLSRLNQRQLAKIIFPLGERTKKSIYRFVEEHGFDDFHGLESQDICFLGNDNLLHFLDKRSINKNNAGPIISTSGKVLGSHNGLFRYTIGQRKGLGISNKTPLYVVGLDAQRNVVIVGENDELLQKYIMVEQLHWLSGDPPELTKKYQIRIRYSHSGATARLKIHGNDQGKIIFGKPQRAITPGQFAVIYDGPELLGSGVIKA